MREHQKMNDFERVIICKALAEGSLWGQGGHISVLLEKLDKRLPGTPTWGQLYTEHEKNARHEYLGVITDDKILQNRLNRGCWLTNWDDDGCSLFNPPPTNGLNCYVSKELADRYKR